MLASRKLICVVVLLTFNITEIRQDLGKLRDLLEGKTGSPDACLKSCKTGA